MRMYTLEEYLRVNKIPRSVAAETLGVDQSTVWRIIKSGWTSYETARRIDDWTEGQVHWRPNVEADSGA